MKYVILAVGSLLLSSWSSAFAVEVEDVNVADSATVGGQALVLNGVGVRTKLFFDIYIGALYLPAKSDDAAKVIHSAGNKRVWMHFLYSEVSLDKLVAGWNDGFKNNQSEASMAALQARLDSFNALFSSMIKGDELTFDFVADDTVVFSMVNKQEALLAKISNKHCWLCGWVKNLPMMV